MVAPMGVDIEALVDELAEGQARNQGDGLDQNETCHDEAGDRERLVARDKESIHGVFRLAVALGLEGRKTLFDRLVPVQLLQFVHLRRMGASIGGWDAGHARDGLEGAEGLVLRGGGAGYSASGLSKGLLPGQGALQFGKTRLSLPGGPR